MRSVDLWTDGANGGRNGTPGGWCAILDHGGFQLAISGADPSTSNNRMELMAVIRGLEALGDAHRYTVIIHTDSAYVKNPHTQGWLKRWQRNGWKSHLGDDVANQDLWKMLAVLVEYHQVRWKKVKGHTKVFSLNTVADRMAVEAKKAARGVTVVL